MAELPWHSEDNPWTEHEDYVASLFVHATKRGVFQGKTDEEVNALMSSLLSRRSPDNCGRRIDLFMPRPPYSISGKKIDW